MEAKNIEQLLEQPEPLKALGSQRYDELTREVKAAVNTYAGFIARYQALSEAETTDLGKRLEAEPLATLESEGIPREILPGFLLLVDAPKEIIQASLPKPSKPGEEILPIVPAYWGAQMLLRSPAGQRLITQAAVQWAPKALKWAGTQAGKGVLLLNP